MRLRQSSPVSGEPPLRSAGSAGSREVRPKATHHKKNPTVTIAGEPYTVELVIEDNQSLTDKAISAARSLVSKNVSVVLGSYGSEDHGHVLADRD